jgi:hypothetical protein
MSCERQPTEREPKDIGRGNSPAAILVYKVLRAMPVVFMTCFMRKILGSCEGYLNGSIAGYSAPVGSITAVAFSAGFFAFNSFLKIIASTLSNLF